MIEPHFSFPIVDDSKDDRTTFYYRVPTWLDRYTLTLFLVGLLGLSFVFLSVYTENFFLGSVFGAATLLWLMYYRPTPYVRHEAVYIEIISFLQGTGVFVTNSDPNFFCSLNTFLMKIEWAAFKRSPYSTGGDFVLSYIPGEETDSYRSVGHFMQVNNDRGEVAITIYHTPLRPPYQKYIKLYNTHM